MYGQLDISTSALIAHRVRLDVISANLANKDVILNAEGQYEPFRRRIAMLAAGDPSGNAAGGVHVASIELDNSPLVPKYEPDSKFADAEGMVYYPNINPVIEQVNAMEVARSYEANIMAIEATKLMMNSALQLLA